MEGHVIKYKSISNAILIVFICILSLENEKKACNHPMLILNSGYRQVTMRINKQEQSTPCRREPSELLALIARIICRYSN